MTRRTKDAYGERMRPNAVERRLPELTPRLRKIADWVPEGARIADVGTDHAYLPVFLRLQGRIAHAIASDLRSGPLERAKRTGARYRADGIDYRLCDGLSAISPDEVELIVVAGMGGETILSILSQAPWTADGRHTLLLQPMSHSDRLRRCLCESGYTIRREALVEDRGKLYPVMEVTAGWEALSEGQLWGGAKLLRDPLGERYLIETIIRLQIALGGHLRSGRASAQADALRATITALLRQREEWRHANSQTN